MFDLRSDSPWGFPIFRLNGAVEAHARILANWNHESNGAYGDAYDDKCELG